MLNDLDDPPRRVKHRAVDAMEPDVLPVLPHPMKLAGDRAPFTEFGPQPFVLASRSRRGRRQLVMRLANQFAVVITKRFKEQSVR